MPESESAAKHEFLIEEYKQRHDYLQMLAADQRIVALAILAFNGLALFPSAQQLGPIVYSLMTLVGLFGIVHNNRLIARYDGNREPLLKVAEQLGIKSVVPEGKRKWYDPTTMRAWFYFLYAVIAMFWVVQALDWFI